MRIGWPSLALGFVLGLGTLACSGSESTQPESTQPESTLPASTQPTSTLPTSTVDGSGTAGTAPSPATTGPPTSADVNLLADGSGCTPGPGPLPDGRWFGFVDSIDPAAMTIDFDLACWFTGEAADIASGDDGGEVPVPNDYYIRNASDQIRTLDFGENPSIRYLASTGDPTTLTDTTVDAWAAARAGDAFRPGVWLTVQFGRVVAAEEQFVP
jgi:hypothetical protein